MTFARVCRAVLAGVLAVPMMQALATTTSSSIIGSATIAANPWVLMVIPGARAGVELQVLKRSSLALPARYAVVVVPGSGCTGWRPVAARYFAGLLHAELLVLHKPGVHVDAGLAPSCTTEFVQNDTLTSWRDHSRAALRAYFSGQDQPDPALPVLLVGISEGAELLPDLAPEVPHLAGVVMISAPGLDPLETGELQARQIGQWPAWLDLKRLQGSNASDDTLAQGRTLGYWRDFWHWQLTRPLLGMALPLLRVWGASDAQVPESAYQRFTQLSRNRLVPSCNLRLPKADHGLQSSGHDGLQWLWARIEAWGRHTETDLCEMVLTQ